MAVYEWPCTVCDDDGIYMPKHRFETVAKAPDGRRSLKICKLCGMLWDDTGPHQARPVTLFEALDRYPGVKF